MSYQQVTSAYRQMLDELPQLEAKVTNAKTKLAAASDAIIKNKQTLAGLEEYLKQYQNEVKDKKAQLEQELSAKMKELNVAKNEVEQVAALKAELSKKNLDLKTVLKLAKEF